MIDIEQRLRDGLAEAARTKPELGPIDIDEVIARSETVGAPRRSVMTRWLAAAAAVVVVVGVGLSLWFSGGPGFGHGIEARPAGPVSTPLIGTTWQVSRIHRTPVLPDPSGSAMTLILQNKTALSGSDGCNGFSGSYALNGDQLRLSDIASTLMGCSKSEALQRQEAAYVVALSDVGRMSIEGSTLTLFDASGAELLVFQPSAKPSPSTVPDPSTEPNPSTEANPSTTPATTVQIRIRNDSTATLNDVRVIFGGGKHVTYGSIAPGQATTYREAGTAYAYAYVRATVNGKTKVLQPIDYVGETPLRPGRYSYVLELSHSELNLSFETDQ